MRSSTDTIIKAMTIMANDIGLFNPELAQEAISEAAERLKEMQALLNQWMHFSSDVAPSFPAGVDWLEILRAKTKAVVDNGQDQRI